MEDIRDYKEYDLQKRAGRRNARPPAAPVTISAEIDARFDRMERRIDEVLEHLEDRIEEVESQQRRTEEELESVGDAVDNLTP